MPHITPSSCVHARLVNMVEFHYHNYGKQWRDFADVFTITNQSTLSSSKRRSAQVDLTQSSEPSKKEGQPFPKERFLAKFSHRSGKETAMLATAYGGSPWQRPLGADRTPWASESMKTGTALCNLKALNSAKKLKCPWKRFIP